ncbi:MAG: acyl-[Clostridia bacterium]|nr:acyl-[acyl-carrier-protein] thioesterase [Clostridia bacterium]
MYMHRIPITVDPHDTDLNGVCRASALLQYMQTAADHQLAERGMTYEALRAQNRAFLLSRIQMEFTDSPRAYTHLLSGTTPCESRGFRFLRCYELTQDDVVIGRAVSVWALIDTESRALIRSESFPLPCPLSEAPSVVPAPIRFPSLLREIGTYTVTYAELDQNAHMNNTHYPDIYAHFLPMRGHRIEGLSISYMHEARQGDVLRVLCAEADGVYYFRTLLADGTVNTEAEVRLASLL